MFISVSDVTAQLLAASFPALDLAQGRYNLGLADIVALTQAQLNVTQAEIENLSAKYDYQSQYALLQYSMGLAVSHCMDVCKGVA
ncbi:MAG: TolC family protein [Terriglobia bacterium]